MSSLLVLVKTSRPSQNHITENPSLTTKFLHHLIGQNEGVLKYRMRRDEETTEIGVTCDGKDSL